MDALTTTRARQVQIETWPFKYPLRVPGVPAWQNLEQWPCRWVQPEQLPAPPFVMLYRRRFSLNAPDTVRIHVSADERYDLYLDGKRIGRGSERGDRNHWFFESYDLELAPGEHTLCARVWSLGALRPWAQLSVYHGLIVAPEDPAWLPQIGTGVASWEVRQLAEYRFTELLLPPNFPLGGGPGVELDGTLSIPGWERGEGTDWRPVRAMHSGTNGFYLFSGESIHLLHPATLPPQLDRPLTNRSVRFITQPNGEHVDGEPIVMSNDRPDEHEAWAQLLATDEPLLLPPHTRRRVLIDLETYRCFYPELEVRGGKGGSVTLTVSETLFTSPTSALMKGHRDQIDGKYMLGTPDRILTAGQDVPIRFAPLDWRCGRYLEVLVRSAEEPLVIERLALRETGYPLEPESSWNVEDKHLTRLLDVCVHTLRMCAHETYMDCPYYERLMYVGDTRIQALLTYVLTGDTKLPRKALQLFDASRLNFSGLVTDSYPSIGKLIPPFALWWVGMVYDYALWRGDPAFIATMMPGVRAVLERFVQARDDAGLVRSLPGWNFADWCPEWPDGVPPGGYGEVSGLINWHVVYALAQAISLEHFIGETELAARSARLAAQLVEALRRTFWHPEQGLFADDTTHQAFSIHTQCLALLSGMLAADETTHIARALLNPPAAVVMPSIYFTHYLFEAYHQLGRGDIVQQRLDPWVKAIENGCRTLPETFGDARSDCHAWGAHPLYHYIATILGVRPAGPGFQQILIRPQLGSLHEAQARIVHPKGMLEIALRRDEGAITGSVTLPTGVFGVFHYAHQQVALVPGLQHISIVHTD
jgi:alpha-L-rhamnosidase